jgi:transcriptional regulator with XRE-family HTH domain
MWLRRQREAAGLTQEELAERAGLAVRTISNLERGQTRRPHARSIRVLAGALGLAEGVPGELTRSYRRSYCDGYQRPVPRTLPGGVPNFTPRPAEMAALAKLLDQVDPDGGGPVIAAISGTAGAGKTTLALHWARQADARFPDGQLYANLRGFDPRVTPATPSELIRMFLDALGVPAQDVPPDLAARAALYRSLLTGKRMLLVLDNARDEQQVRPLLPAAAGCMVIVTSRKRLVGLGAVDGAQLLTLGVLSSADAHAFLASRLGAQRVAAEPEAVADVAALCAGLPLALAVAAGRLAARPGFLLSAVAAELRDSGCRLDALDTGDPSVSVRAAISWSVRQLSAPASRMFRLLGLAPWPDVGLPAAASLAGVCVAEARAQLAELAAGHLVEEHAPGRFGMHDLLRVYAREQAAIRQVTARLAGAMRPGGSWTTT